MAKPWRIVGMVVGGLLLAIALLACWLYSASQQTPTFYEQALAAPPPGQAEASDELLHQATTLANRARREGKWEATFTADEINGWLAVDFLKNHAQSLPPGVSEPRVEIRPEGATVACRWQHGGLKTVLSLHAELYVAEPNVVALRIHAARAGSMPLPLDGVLDGLSEAAANLDVAVRWLQADGDPVAMITIPPPKGEHDSRIWIESLELRDGAIYLAGKTVPHDEKPGRSPPSLGQSGELQASVHERPAVKSNRQR